MTDKDVIFIFGKPDKINKNAAKWGADEQWKYSGFRWIPHTSVPDKYLYFENGILTSW